MFLRNMSVNMLKMSVWNVCGEYVCGMEYVCGRYVCGIYVSGICVWNM